MRGTSGLTTAILLVASASGALGDPGPTSVDLVFYGDTRAGLFQSATGPYTPLEIHTAVATQIGDLTDLSSQRGILFVGDAVSQAGCDAFWDTKFFPVLRQLTAFHTTTGYLFFPVIGDHETYLIPESYDEAAHTPSQCAFFDATYRYPAAYTRTAQVKPRASLHRPLTKTEYANVEALQRLPAQVRCTAATPTDCTAPLLQTPDQEMNLAHCLMCQYQRDVCNGNCASFAFTQEYTRDNGFSPFQDAFATASAGATWYLKDWSVTDAAGHSRRVRGLFVDTQADTALTAKDNKTQAQWLVAVIDALNPGDDLVLVGHQTPTLREDLFGPAISEAFAKGVRVLAVITGHYHGFGSGTYTVRAPAGNPGTAPVTQEVYFAVTGDGGSRDLSKREKVTECATIGKHHKIQNLVLTAVPNKPWKSDDTASKAAFGRLTITYDRVDVIEYQVSLAPNKAIQNPIALDELRVEDIGSAAQRFESHSIPLRSTSIRQ